MKRIILSASFALFSIFVFAQGEWVSASIANGASASKVDLYIQTTTAFDANKVDNLVFTVRVPKTAGSGVAVTETFKAAAFAHITFAINKINVDDGVYFYYLVNGTGAVVPAAGTTITAGAPFRVLELTFSGGVHNGMVELVNIENDLPGNLFIRPQFYIQINLGDITNLTAMFYGTAGAVPTLNAPVTGDDWVPTAALVVLPVTFSKYAVACSDKGTSITWTTQNEQNSSHYEVEKNTGGQWIKIAHIPAAGNSSTEKNYQYFDLSGGVAQYRIKQVDLDGKFLYTAIRQASCENKSNQISIYPVPAKDNMTVSIKTDRAIRTTLQVFDVSGKMVKNQPIALNSGINNVPMSVANLAAGEYVIRSNDPSIMLNKKFTVAR